MTTLLVGVAAAVAYAVARDANRDVEFVGERVRGMVHVRSEPTGEAVPVRTMDEVGALTVAFNALVDRFAAAQSSYKSDLARVRAADRDRAAFLAAVSHELRSPLNAILGFADILMTEVDGPLSAEAREEVEQIRGSGKHLLDLINDILELSALESGQLRLTRTRVDLAAVAREVVREAAGLVGDASRRRSRAGRGRRVRARRREARAAGAHEPRRQRHQVHPAGRGRGRRRPGRTLRAPQRSRHGPGHQPAGAGRHLRGVQADEGGARAEARDRAWASRSRGGSC